MAFSSTCIAEIRSAATAANANGGIWDTAGTGTDWSQQDAAKYNLTGGASAGAGAVILHASASTDMAGNGLRLVSGTNATASWYLILSVVAGVSITVDRNCTTGVGASIVCNIGGAWSLQNANDGTALNLLVAGNKAWIKNGSYALTGTLNLNTAIGTTTSYVAFEGYNSSRGDAPTGSTRPSITGKSILLNDYMRWSNIIWSTSTTDTFSPGRFNQIYTCKFLNSSTTAAVTMVTPGDKCGFYRCEFSCYRGICFQHANEHTIYGSYFHDSDIGVKNTNSGNNYGCNYIGCIFDSMVTVGIRFVNNNNGIDMVDKCTFFGGITNKTGIGIDIATGSTNKIFTNNIFTGLATGIACADASGALVSTSFLMNWNSFSANTANVSNLTLGAQDVTTAPSFQNVAQLTGTTGVVSGSTLVVTSATGIVINQDFVYIISGTGATAGQYLITNVSGTTLTLSSAPGGSGTNINYQITTGRNFLATGLAKLGALGVFPGGLTTGYQNIGAAQSVPTLATTFGS